LWCNYTQGTFPPPSETPREIYQLRIVVTQLIAPKYIFYNN
jgi:hypothetical protein